MACSLMVTAKKCIGFSVFTNLSDHSQFWTLGLIQMSPQDLCFERHSKYKSYDKTQDKRTPEHDTYDVSLRKLLLK